MVKRVIKELLVILFFVLAVGLFVIGGWPPGCRAQADNAIVLKVDFERAEARRVMRNPGREGRYRVSKWLYSPYESVAVQFKLNELCSRDEQNIVWDRHYGIIDRLLDEGWRLQGRYQEDAKILLTAYINPPAGLDKSLRTKIYSSQRRGSGVDKEPEIDLGLQKSIYIDRVVHALRGYGDIGLKDQPSLKKSKR